VSWDRGSHQRLVEGRICLLGRWRGLFGYARVAFPTICDEAGDPEARADQLRGNRWQREVVGEAVSSAKKCVCCPTRPVITRAKDPVDARAFAVLDDVGDALVPQSSFTGRLKQVFHLGGLHVFGTSANFGGKYLVEFFTLGQGPRGEHTHIRSPIVQALGDDSVDSPGGGSLDGDRTDRHEELPLHKCKGGGVSRVDRVLYPETLEGTFGLQVDGLGDPARGVHQDMEGVRRWRGHAPEIERPKFVRSDREVEDHGVGRDQVRGAL